MQRIGGPVILIVIFVLLAAVGGGLYFVLGVDASGTEIRPLTANANVVTHKALKLSVEPANVPQGFKVGLNSITPDDFPKSAAEPFKTAREKLPGYLSVVSPVYTCGRIPRFLRGAPWPRRALLPPVSPFHSPSPTAWARAKRSTFTPGMARRGPLCPTAATVTGWWQ
jgi:hypothetical protein